MAILQFGRCRALVALSAVGLSLGWMMGTGPARAQSASQTLTYKATVATICTIQHMSGGTSAVLDFGRHLNVASVHVMDLDSGGHGWSIRCNKATPVPVTVTLDAGEHEVSGQRHMAGPAGALIPYDLYRDSALTKALDVPFEIDIPTTGASPIIYGRARVPAGTHDGFYFDRVRITVAY